MGKQLRLEIVEWGVLVMVTVILSVVLLTMRQSSTVSCPSGYFYNASQLATEACCGNSTCSINASTNSLFSDVGTYVSAFQEPKNWIVIVIIGLIGLGLIKYWKTKN